MIDPADVPPVDGDKLLARFVLQRSHVRADQTVKPDAFIPHPHHELSVTRHRSATPAEIWMAGQAVADVRAKTLYGRADVLEANTRLRTPPGSRLKPDQFRRTRTTRMFRAGRWKKQHRKISHKKSLRSRDTSSRRWCRRRPNDKSGVGALRSGEKTASLRARLRVGVVFQQGAGNPLKKGDRHRATYQFRRRF